MSACSVTGRRVRECAGPHELQPGDYWRAPEGDWYGRSPNGHRCNLSFHTVTEHEDGTITVEPSIGIDKGSLGGVYHGWLRAGVWEEA